MRKSTVRIQDRFSKFYDENLEKFNPAILEKLIGQVEVFRGNEGILEDLLGEKVKQIWVSRKGQIAQTISEDDKTATVSIVKGKGAGKEVALWANIRTIDAIVENQTQIDRLQTLIDAVKTIGTDENAVIVARKGRTSKYPDSIMVRFIPSSVAIPELDANERAQRLYNANGEVVGYNLTPNKRASKPNQ